MCTTPVSQKEKVFSIIYLRIRLAVNYANKLRLMTCSKTHKKCLKLLLFKWSCLEVKWSKKIVFRKKEKSIFRKTRKLLRFEGLKVGENKKASKGGLKGKKIKLARQFFIHG